MASVKTSGSPSPPRKRVYLEKKQDDLTISRGNDETKWSRKKKKREKERERSERGKIKLHEMCGKNIKLHGIRAVRCPAA